jgi:hypothetical protein
MKSRITLKINPQIFLTALAIIMLGIASSKATLLLYEGFNYPPGTDSLVGQTGGFGWGGSAWSKQIESGLSAGQDNININYVGAAAFGSYPSTGLGLQMFNNNNGSSPAQKDLLASRQLAGLAVPAHGTIWYSYLFRQGNAGSGGNNSSYFTSGIKMNNTAAKNGAGEYMATFPCVPHFLSDNTQTPEGFSLTSYYQSAPQLTVGQTYLIICKFSNLNDFDFYDPPFGQAGGTNWVLSLSNYEAVVASGPISESVLNTNNTLIQTTTGDDFGVAFGNTNFVQFSANTEYGFNDQPEFAEFKIFDDLTNWLDTVPANYGGKVINVQIRGKIYGIPSPSYAHAGAIPNDTNTFWNGIQLSGQGNETDAGGTFNLNYSDNTASAVTLTTPPAYPYNELYANTYNGHGGNWATNSDGSSCADLLGAWFDGGGGNGNFMTLSNLPPSTSFRLYCYSSSDFPSTCGVFSCATNFPYSQSSVAPGTPHLLTQGVDYLVFNNVVSGADGTLTIYYQHNFSGFQIQAQQSPLPASPALSIQYQGGQVIASWPLASGNFHLQYTTSLSPVNWLNDPNVAGTNGSVISVTEPISTGNRFYRLAYP